MVMQRVRHDHVLLMMLCTLSSHDAYEQGTIPPLKQLGDPRQLLDTLACSKGTSPCHYIAMSKAGVLGVAKDKAYLQLLFLQ